jgi:hypothetical protein
MVELQAEVLGWASAASRKTGPVFELSPKVGVRHQIIHATVDDLLGRRPSLEPTVSILLGYLMPERTANLVWRFEEPQLLEAQAANLVGAVLEYGRPFMEAYVGLEDVLVAMEQHPEFIPDEEGKKRIPVALALLGRHGEALALIDAELARLSGHEYPAATEYREFAASFRSRPPTVLQEVIDTE